MLFTTLGFFGVLGTDKEDGWVEEAESVAAFKYNYNNKTCICALHTCTLSRPEVEHRKSYQLC